MRGVFLTFVGGIAMAVLALLDQHWGGVGVSVVVLVGTVLVFLAVGVVVHLVTRGR